MDRYRPVENLYPTKHVVAAGLFAKDAGSTPAASTICGVFDADELAELFNAARPEVIPFLAIGAFAGLRHAEIARLDWADVKADHIEVKKGKAKTRSRRLVPILPNLQAWLAPHRKPEGPVAAFANMTKQLLWLADDAEIAWRHNALRHSFISYRMAEIKNENAVAAESGNSPMMIYRNYRELVTESQAKAWFSVTPPCELPNVVPLVHVAR